MTYQIIMAAVGSVLSIWLARRPFIVVCPKTGLSQSAAIIARAVAEVVSKEQP